MSEVIYTKRTIEYTFSNLYRLYLLKESKGHTNKEPTKTFFVHQLSFKNIEVIARCTDQVYASMQTLKLVGIGDFWV